uniref:Ig-like domain-containing protein n=1 Tax=Cyprinodon variegatus TaxID=28743 RepID=A0A3Q2CK85_CYPVA
AIFILLLLSLELQVPDQPVVALHGEDVTLNCSFSHTSPFNLSDVSIFWQLTDTKPERYANRTVLFPAQMTMGNASLLLRKVVVADEGSYTCFVRVQDYDSAALFLQVADIKSIYKFPNCGVIFNL